MRNYLSFFEPGGIVVPDKYFIELKNVKGEPTGHKMLKGPEFIITEEIINAIAKLGENVKKYVDIKKSLPKISENSTTVASPSIGTSISSAYYKNQHPNFSFSNYFDNSSDSSGI